MKQFFCCIFWDRLVMSCVFECQWPCWCASWWAVNHVCSSKQLWTLCKGQHWHNWEIWLSVLWHTWFQSQSFGFFYSLSNNFISSILELTSFRLFRMGEGQTNYWQVQNELKSLMWLTGDIRFGDEHINKNCSWEELKKLIQRIDEI